MQQMSQSFVYFFLLCGAAVFILGFVEIFRKKIYGRREEEYTKDSIARFSLYDGLICIAIGITTVASQLSILLNYHPEIFRLIGVVSVLAGIVVDRNLADRMLKKRR